MSTSLLYHTQGLGGFLFETFKFLGGSTIAEVCRAPDKFCCPHCKSHSVTPTRIGTRDIQGLPIGRCCFYLRVKMHRIRCHDCGAYVMEKLPFVPSEKARHTRGLARTVVELRSEMSISAISDYFDLHWTTVKDIEKNI